MDVAQCDDAGAPVEEVNEIPRRVDAVLDWRAIVSPVEEVNEEIDFNIIENELKKEDVVNVFKK